MVTISQHEQPDLFLNKIKIMGRNASNFYIVYESENFLMTILTTKRPEFSFGGMEKDDEGQLVWIQSRLRTFLVKKKLCEPTCKVWLGLQI